MPEYIAFFFNSPNAKFCLYPGVYTPKEKIHRLERPRKNVSLSARGDREEIAFLLRRFLFSQNKIADIQGLKAVYKGLKLRRYAVEKDRCRYK